MNDKFYQPELLCWVNDNDALIPELWAREALRTLMSNMVMGALVNRDYSDMVANFGDVVNTSRPADFSGKRKTDSDSVVQQDAQSPNIPVPLDQHFHVTFVIKDGELSKALPNLIERYLEPAARELAEKVDQVLCGQVVRLNTYEEGRINEMTKTNAPDFVLDANTRLDINRCPKQGRYLVLGPRAQKATLGAELFVSTEKRGDEGTALREASLGAVYGMASFMDQNMPYSDVTAADTATGDTDNAEAAGSTLIETDIADAADITAGCYFTIEGEGKPYRIASKANDPVDITIASPGLRDAVAASAAVTVYRQCEVDEASGYAAGYTKEITLDGFTGDSVRPQLGQGVTFGTGASSHSYTVIAVDNSVTGHSTVLLDRPLDSALTDGDACFPHPAGGWNLAFHRDAVALVNRPLALPQDGMGARSFVASFDGLSMRVVMQYDSEIQGTRVTFDLLCGVAVLDDRLACVLYS